MQSRVHGQTLVEICAPRLAGCSLRFDGNKKRAARKWRALANLRFSSRAPPISRAAQSLGRRLTSRIHTTGVSKREKLLKRLQSLSRRHRLPRCRRRCRCRRRPLPPLPLPRAFAVASLARTSPSVGRQDARARSLMRKICAHTRMSTAASGADNRATAIDHRQRVESAIIAQC